VSTAAHATAGTSSAGSLPFADLRWLQALAGRIGWASAYSLVIYVVTRAAVMFGAFAGYVYGDKVTWHSIVTKLDAYWYQHIAQAGYGHHLHPSGVPPFHARFSSWAFYPGYPIEIRIVHEVTRLPYAPAAVVAAALMGFLAVRALWSLGDAFGGPRVGLGTAALAAAWPGSVLFTLPYSEGTYIAATAAALAALLRRRWILAGVLGAAASFTRAMGVALVVAAFVVAVGELRDRNWRAMAAPVLSALGLVSFYLYGWQQTGDALVWRHAEDLWGQKLDFGKEMFRWVHQSLDTGGLKGDAAILYLVGAALLALFVVAGLRMGRAARTPLVVYAVVAGALVVLYGAVGTRPRMVMAIVPGFVWLAAWLRDRGVGMLAAAFASMLPLVAFLYCQAIRV
jgi:hypothetical protein